MNEKTVINGPVYDARTLGTPRMLILGLQHMFAMFGATVLVPILTGIDIATTLLFAGLGTLLFHLLTKRKVPAFLGSSFAFIGGYNAITGFDSSSGVPVNSITSASGIRDSPRFTVDEIARERGYIYFGT